MTSLNSRNSLIKTQKSMILIQTTAFNSLNPRIFNVSAEKIKGVKVFGRFLKILRSKFVSHVKSAGKSKHVRDKMSELDFKPVLQETSSLFRDEPFSTMYFGRHCGKNVLILKHDLTFLLVFKDDDPEWTRPEFAKPVCCRGNPGKGIKIVGNKDVVLLLDGDGNLWRLINAFEVSDEKYERLHSLEEKCFYEWVPFRKFNFDKVLAICEYGCGFACVGISRNLERKLVVLPSIDSSLEDYTFECLSTNNSFSYYLTNLNIDVEKFVCKSEVSPKSEVLLVGDRFSGKLYLCSKPGRKSLINQSDVNLVSVLSFQSESCLVVCLESGKLIFSFYNESDSNCVVYLSKRIVCIEKCCCAGSCLLWSDGVRLHHTKVSFGCGDMPVKVSHLRLNCAVVCPLSLLKIGWNVLTITINGIYYVVSPGMGGGEEVQKQLQEVLNEIYTGSGMIQQLQRKIDALTYYLRCKETIQKNKAKAEISREGKRLLIRGCGGTFLRDFWKVKLTTWTAEKSLVEVVDLESDLREGVLIGIENPFKGKSETSVGLVGDFNGNNLFVNLGKVVGGNETDSGTILTRKRLKEIMGKRNPYVKETSAPKFTSKLY